MIATLQPEIIELADKASPAAIQAAKSAASNQHALINLIRLVKSLDAKANSEEDDVLEPYAVKKEWETVLYTRALLDALKEENEQSSSTSSSLKDLDRELASVEKSFRIRLTSPAPTPSLNPALIALPMTPNPSNPISADRLNTSIPISRSIASSVKPPSPVLVPPADGVRKRKSRVDEHLASRSKAELSDSNTQEDLLPLKSIIPPKKSGPGSRDSLLAGAGPGMGIGAAQIHEELGGQLADMSHRLKLNAVHFANSLENEKSLLEDSQNVLENNLTATRSSKKHLSSVSSKGRSTTCLTLGVVFLVMILFVWTYMLIRFT
ncbi:uncharacterized protein IL334_003552 [Kwoniella shivajii]|uniref:Uncharacterized protein n=1 Tax=Kwoniella shivajii TaxID=564305 RepID=A0ABZ1CXW4_9TREE|nr:hypothetical protein IL334_003552 [Kwoniella shivajii]